MNGRKILIGAALAIITLALPALSEAGPLRAGARGTKHAVGGLAHGVKKLGKGAAIGATHPFGGALRHR